MVSGTSAGTRLEPVDSAFLEAFVPREIRLVQRRILGHPGGGGFSAAQLGLFILELVPKKGASLPPEDHGGSQIRTTLLGMLAQALRFSDIAGTLGNGELLGIARDLDGDQAFQIAQRILAHAGRLELLKAAGLTTRLAYVVYPLSTQPDLEPGEWHLLLDLARSLFDRDAAAGIPSGCGVLRAEGAPPNIPEGDLVRLAFHDLETLTTQGLLRLQRIHILPGF